MPAKHVKNTPLLAHNPTCSYMKLNLILVAASLAALANINLARAQTILQPADGSAVAFEADIGTASIFNTADTTKASWISAADANASGGTALYANTTNVPPYANGINGAGGPQFGRPNSFITYNIQFSQPGTYYLYYRWRANPAVVAANSDNSQGNSAYLPSTFGSFVTPGSAANFFTAAANGVAAPASTSYQWTTEATTYTVAAAGAQVFTIGDREWGIFLDRIVLSTNSTLTAAQLDATPNVLTSVIPQGLNDNYLAFEADRPAGAGATYLNTADTTKVAWVSATDASASGGTALYANTTNVPPYPNGINGAGGPQFGRPNSFVTYDLNFSQAGTYNLYYRWRANPAVVAANSDNSQANSAYLPNTLGTFTTPGNSSSLFTAAANGVAAPPSTTYQWTTEATTYSVGAPGPQVFSLADREWGFFLDRIVLSTTAGLTGSQLDGLANSGGLATPPKLKQVTGAWGNTSVVVTFSDSVNPSTVWATNFTLNGGVTVTGASVNPGKPSAVTLTTSAQPQGTALVLTVKNVASAVTGLPVAAGSTANFTSWRLASGWALEEVYYGGGGSALGITNVASYTNNSPDATYWVKGLQADHFPDGNVISVRVTTILTPTNTDTYSLYGVADDDAALFYSSNTTASVLGRYDLVPDLAFLTGFSSLPASAPPLFSATGPFPLNLSLSAGSNYVIQALLNQVVQDMYVKIGLDSSSSSADPSTLPALGGNLISVWVNPDLGNVTISQQPTNTTGSTHSRATFTVKATSDSGQSPLFYQWRSNGVNIAGANLRTYITPLLDSSYNGTVYSVVVSVAGKDTVSSNATLTVVPGVTPAVAPYVGISFAGGDYQVVPSALGARDVAGVIRQGNWNNLYGGNYDGTTYGLGGSLVDANGITNGVSLVGFASATYITGTKINGDADGILLQGYSDGVGTASSYELDGVANGTYNVLVYSVGFSFNATYEEAFDLTSSAGSSFPTYHVKAQTGADYNAHPGFVRMASTNPGARDLGNYVQFDNVSVGTGDTLTITATPESPLATEIPAINAIQLVRVMPGLSISLSGTTVTISWPYAAYGFTLESSPTLGPSAVWSPVGAAPNQITGAGSISVSTAGPPRFYRLRK
jgi:hypothetical protein